MSSQDCNIFTEKILTYLKHPSRYQPELEAALDHMSDCPECQMSTNFIIQSLATNEEDSLADIAALAYGEEGSEPPDSLSPDLSFLGQAERTFQTSPPWHWNDIGRLVIKFSNELVISLRPPGYAAASLKKSKHTPQTLCEFALNTADANGVGVKISAKEKRNEPTMCEVTVHVDVEGRKWPHLKGSRVTIKRNETLLNTGLTDKFGNVLFDIDRADLPLLTFEILPIR